MNDDPRAHGIDEYAGKFARLAEEARPYGVMACIVLQSEDPLTRQTVVSEIFQGNRILQIGMLQQALWHLQQQT